MGRGAGVLPDDRQPRLSPARGRSRSIVLRSIFEEQADAARRHRLDRIEFCAEPGEVLDRAAGLMSSRRTPGPITTGSSCFNKAVDHHSKTTTAAAYGSRIALACSLVRDDG